MLIFMTHEKCNGCVGYAACAQQRYFNGGCGGLQLGAVGESAFDYDINWLIGRTSAGTACSSPR